MEEERKIPYVGCVRVGNFKLWKSKERRKGKVDVDVLRISDMEGTWGVKIPQTYLAYPMIEQCYKEGNEEFIHTYIANVNFVSSIANGFFQRGVAMVGHAYLKPELLREGYNPAEGPGHADMMDEARKICEGFLEWYEQVQAEEKARADADGGRSLDEDELADKAADILSKE